MMWDNNDAWMHGSGAGGWFMFIGLIAIVVAAVLLIVYLVRQTSQPVSAGVHPPQGYPQSQIVPPAQESPRDILKRRYASGEIEREDYLQRLADL
jgi:putative membrane protein